MDRITIKRYITIILVLLLSVELFSQTAPSLPDTVQSDTTKYEMKKSPWGAVLRSAVLPGYGQFYNESYWKIPLIWGVLGYLGYQWDDRNKLYQDYRDLYNQSLLETVNGNEIYYKRREDYRDQRDLLAVFIGLTYFLNLIDAYVDAHLFDFTIEENNAVTDIQFSIRVKL